MNKSQRQKLQVLAQGLTVIANQLTADTKSDAVMDDKKWKQLQHDFKKLQKSWLTFLKNDVDLSGTGIEVSDLIKEHRIIFIKLQKMIKSKTLGDKVSKKFIHQTIEDELLKDEILEQISESIGEDTMHKLFNYS